MITVKDCKVAQHEENKIIEHIHEHPKSKTPVSQQSFLLGSFTRMHLSAKPKKRKARRIKSISDNKKLKNKKKQTPSKNRRRKSVIPRYFRQGTARFMHE